MDIIITKFDKKDTVEWIRTFPYLFDIHNATDETLYTEYIAAVDSNIYLIHNENIENPMFPNNQGIKPGEFKPVGRIHGSNLVCSIINKEGNLVNKSVLMKNENYCFSPQRNRIGVLSPPSGNDVFIQDEENIFIYTEDRGKPRFVRVDIK